LNRERTALPRAFGGVARVAAGAVGFVGWSGLVEAG
jgi:hypothetical protein